MCPRDCQNVRHVQVPGLLSLSSLALCNLAISTRLCPVVVSRSTKLVPRVWYLEARVICYPPSLRDRHKGPSRTARCLLSHVPDPQLLACDLASHQLCTRLEPGRRGSCIGMAKGRALYQFRICLLPSPSIRSFCQSLSFTVCLGLNLCPELSLVLSLSHLAPRAPAHLTLPSILLITRPQCPSIAPCSRRAR